MKQHHIRIQRIVGLLAALFALVVLGVINALRRKDQQHPTYSDAMAGKVVLARSINSKSCRRVIAGLIRGIAFGVILVTIVVWVSPYNNCSTLWNFLKWSGHACQLILYANCDCVGIDGYTALPPFVAPSDIWKPSDLELSMMKSRMSEAENLVFSASMFVGLGQEGQDHSAQMPVDLDYSYFAKIVIQGMSSQSQRNLNIPYADPSQPKSTLRPCQR
jgi:hypothetical protein